MVIRTIEEARAWREGQSASAADKEKRYQAALADLKALLAPLDKIASLLPSAVKKILDKYRG